MKRWIWRGNPIRTAGLAVAFGILCAWSLILWFAHPGLYDDDFLRVGSLRRATLGESLFRPFNEHMAPLFEVVSWLAWQGARQDVLRIARAFEVSAYLAFGLTASTLGAVALLEIRSRAAALVCVAIFALSTVSAETVLWFSASSFEWSAWVALVAWYCAIRAVGSPTRRDRLGWLIGSGLASLAAPAFSAVGILAGPLASLRILLGADRRLSIGQQVACATVPLVGLLAYLLICHQFAYSEVLSTSVQRNLDLRTAIGAAFQAPAAVLVPALFGQGSLIRRLPGWSLTLATIVGLTAGLIASRRRPWIVAALALIVGGYLATYATRARAGDLEIFEVQRYHLFPQIGFALLVAASLRPILVRFDRSWASSLVAAIVFAALLVIAQTPRIRSAAERNFRDVEQPRALAATLRLETLCEREGVTLIQAMHALEPVRAPWFPKSGQFHPMLHLFGPGVATSRIPDDQVRPTLIAGLSINDREAIFGGMNAPCDLVPQETGQKPSASRLVGMSRMRPIDGQRYWAAGRGSWLEFEIATPTEQERRLILPDLQARNEVQVWWAGADGHWSSFQSVYWTRCYEEIPGANSAILLDRLPHWRPGFARRVRLVFREWGPVSAGVPRFAP